MCQGYYRHTEGYTPEWPGMDRFQGRIVHPQTWPDDLDYAGKQVVVIGSGATAATLIPAMAPDCAHITMLQRSPTFFFSGRNVNELADTLRELDIPEEWIHEIVRRKILLEQGQITQLSVEHPELVREGAARGRSARSSDRTSTSTPTSTRATGRGSSGSPSSPTATCSRASRAGRPRSSPTRSSRFTETGHPAARPASTLEADIIVTATGFNLNVLGDIEFTIDGDPLDFADTVTYRGMMFTGIPNMVWVFGYFRASWTLRVDLIGDFVCRLLQHMDELGAAMVTPALRPEDADMPLLPWVDPENFNPGYLDAGHAPDAQAGRPRPVAPHPGLLDREGRAPGRRPRRRCPPLPTELADGRPRRRRRRLLLALGVVLVLGAAAAWLFLGGDEPRPVTVEEAQERTEGSTVSTAPDGQFGPPAAGVYLYEGEGTEDTELSAAHGGSGADDARHDHPGRRGLLALPDRLQLASLAGLALLRRPVRHRLHWRHQLRSP